MLGDRGEVSQVSSSRALGLGSGQAFPWKDQSEKQTIMKGAGTLGRMRRGRGYVCLGTMGGGGNETT